MLKKQRFDRVPVKEIESSGSTIDTNVFNPVTLVVDDEPMIADTLAAILTQSGYSTFIAYNGESALELASVVPPQILITDVVMPGMSGFDLALAVKRVAPDCKVVVLSGIVDKLSIASRQQYLQYDFHFIAKPAPVPELLALISGFRANMIAQPAPRKMGKRTSAAERSELRVRKLQERIARRLSQNSSDSHSDSESLRN
jgi:YesN/AraC family two-component response regulator